MKRNTFIKSSIGLAAASGILTSFTNFDKPVAIPKVIPKGLVRGDFIGITAPAGSIWNTKHIEKITIVRAF